MKTLINKIKTIKKVKLAEAIPYIVAGSLLLFGCNDKENQKILRSEKSDYVEFYDNENKLIYTDLRKDGILDVVYNDKNSLVLNAFEIVDNFNLAEDYFT